MTGNFKIVKYIQIKFSLLIIIKNLQKKYIANTLYFWITK